jgi:hypothetical protein
MSSLAQRILQVAEGEVGVHESGGPNRGGCEKYQRPYGTWMVGQPWCAAWIGWVWSEAGVPDARAIASPSTAIMCSTARAKGLVCMPRPGAALVWCGTHVGLLHTHLGGSTWRTIEGNSGDAVNWRTRDVSGCLVYGPPGLVGAEAKEPEPEVLYYLDDDFAAPARSQPFPTKEARDAALADFRPEEGAVVRRWHNRSGHGFTIGVRKRYGPWRSKEARAKARKTLEKRLGRRLAARSEVRKGTPAAKKAEALGKTT